MEVSASGQKFLCSWEACSLTPYQDIAGNWTVGWGHKMEPTDPHVAITQDEADVLLQHELLTLADTLTSFIEVEVTQSEFDALADFSYNAGVGAFESSTVLRRLNVSDMQGAADALLLWNKARDTATGKLVVNAGLSRRRTSERDLFLNADYSGNA